MARGPGYTLADGTPVPSVTSVLSRFKESGALMYWAWAEGKAGRDYRDTRQAAADAGTLAHQMVEAQIRGRAWDPPPLVDPAILDRARAAFQNYLRWQEQTLLQPVSTELALVSEQYRFGGRLDAMLISGSLSLGDWKTANAVYSDHLLQLAAYGVLWRERFPERPLVGGYHLLRFSKVNGDFTHHHFAELDEAAQMFLLLRQAWDLDKTLRRRIR